MSDTPRFLMCQPDFYQVDYVINVWMEGNVDRSSPDRAAQQWHELVRVLRGHAEVELVRPEQGWPDMVFTANAGLVLGKNAVVSRFFHPERQGEEPFFKAFFEKAGFTVYELPEDLPFEGAATPCWTARVAGSGRATARARNSTRTRSWPDGSASKCSPCA